MKKLISRIQGRLREPKVPVLRALRLAAHGGLRAAGFEWELRRAGDLHLGLWTKRYRRKDPRSAMPKRLVLIPGFGDSAISWLGSLALLRPIISRNFDELVLVDFPGYGGFLAGSRAFHDMDLLTGALGDALDALKPHTILGHSLGGWLAADYAAECGAGRRPHGNARVWSGPSQLLLLNSAGVYESDEFRRVSEERFRRTLEEGLEPLRAHLFKREPRWFPLLASEFGRFLSSPEIGLFLKSFRDDHRLEPKLGQIRARTWILWGEHDSLLPAAAASRWFKGLTGINDGEKQILVIQGAGHSPQIERPAVTAAVIAQCLTNSVGKLPARITGRFWTEF